MTAEKSSVTGSTAMLLLKLLQERDMYGYQMIDELSRRSQNVFELKAGTLYPILCAPASTIVTSRCGPTR